MPHWSRSWLSEGQTDPCRRQRMRETVAQRSADQTPLALIQVPSASTLVSWFSNCCMTREVGCSSRLAWALKLCHCMVTTELPMGSAFLLPPLFGARAAPCYELRRTARGLTVMHCTMHYCKTLEKGIEAVLAHVHAQARWAVRAWPWRACWLCWRATRNACLRRLQTRACTQCVFCPRLGPLP